MTWRDLMCGDVRPEHVGQRFTLSGWAHRRRRPRRPRLHRPPRPGGPMPARDQPRARARGGRDRARRAQRVRPARRGRGRGPRARAREPEPPDGRGRAARRDARDRVHGAAAPVPAGRGGRGRDAAPSLPLAGSAAGEAPAQHRLCGADGVDHPPRDGGGGIPRHPDADPLQADARGRARLHRPEPLAARPLLRAAAVAADPQAAARHRRLRPLLPDRRLLPRRGPPGGSRVRRSRSSTSRWRSPTRSSSSSLDGADGAGGLAGVHRRRARRSRSPPDGVRRRDAALRDGQARSPLRLEIEDATEVTRGAEFKVFAGRRRRALAARAAGVLRAELERLEEVAKEWGAKGSRTSSGRTASRARRSRSSSPRPSSRRSALSRARPCSSPQTTRRSSRECSATFGCNSADELGLVDEDAFDWVWITDFPMFDWVGDRRAWHVSAPSLHRPAPGWEDRFDEEPGGAGVPVRPRRQRERARRRLVQDPRAGRPGAGVPHDLGLRPRSSG